MRNALVCWSMIFACGIAVSGPQPTPIVKSEGELGPAGSSRREKFWNQRAGCFEVPLCILLSNPWLWDGETVTTYGYARAGAGMILLSVNPETPRGCYAELGVSKFSPLSKTEIQKLKSSMVRIKAKLIFLGYGALSGAPVAFEDGIVDVWAK